MNIKKSAFTLAEALIILLITSLIIAALIPVLTRKHRAVVPHGKWICTLNNNAQHVIKTIYNGEDSGFSYAGSSCTFTPPANVKNFTVKAVAGGGGGAGGTSGKKESFYDSRTDGKTFAKNIKYSGTYSVVYIGGGGGGGGMACGEASTYTAPNLANEAYFDSSNSGKYNSNDWTWDKYSQSHSSSTADEVNKRSPYDNKIYKYGYVDQPVAGFPYKLLTKNDELFTETKDSGQYTLTDASGNNAGKTSAYEFKYNYLQNAVNLKKQILCFAENNWPLSKEVNGDRGIYLQDANKKNIKCWNLPGTGGKNAKPNEESGTGTAENIFFNAGQSIYATVGRGGQGEEGTDSKYVGLYLPDNNGNLYIKNSYVYNGKNGRDGEDTVIDYGEGSRTSRGGKGGKARVISYLTYVNIPVMECEIVKTEGYFTNNSSCSGYSASICSSKPGCYTYDSFASCTGDSGCAGRSLYNCKNFTVNETQEDGTVKPVERVCKKNYVKKCTSGSHKGPKYEVGTCRKVVRSTYFAGVVPSCIYNGEPDFALSDLTKADYPHFNNPVNEVISSGDDMTIAALFGRKRYKGEPGSGGYGVGEQVKNYILPTNTGAKGVLRGEAGEEGGIVITRITFMGGTGGQAGSYVSTMFKKLDKLQINVGAGGGPSGADSQANGHPGGTTTIKKYGTGSEGVILSLSGGLPGQANKVVEATGMGSVVAGGNGAPSPMENHANKAKIIPLGGKAGANTNMSGLSPRTEIWKNPTASALGLASMVQLYFIGGDPLDVTYGAGGGGGAGGENSSGAGGAGAPGAVIIEW